MREDNEPSNEMSTKQALLILVLVVVAAALGYIIYAGSTDNDRVVPQYSQEETDDAAVAPENDTNATETDTQRSQVLNFTPGANTTQQEQREHFQLVQRMATEADTVVFENCIADPVVLRLSHGDQFDIQNEGGAEIDVPFGTTTTHNFTLEPNEVHTVQSGELFAQPAVYAYSCISGDSAKRAGILLLTNSSEGDSGSTATDGN